MDLMREMERILSFVKDPVLVREDQGEVNIPASLALSVAKMQDRIDTLQTSRQFEARDADEAVVDLELERVEVRRKQMELDTMRERAEAAELLAARRGEEMRKQRNALHAVFSHEVWAELDEPETKSSDKQKVNTTSLNPSYLKKKQCVESYES